jgi:putative spermidine/putrescine transport system ATP-binding protein
MGQIGATIEIKELVKKFDSVIAVNGVDIEIKSGEFLTLLGPSGSGKTTTLNLVAGFEIPTAGKIILGGEDIAYKPPHKRNLGMVFQNYALFPHMKVFENIAFPLRARKVSQKVIKERVGETLSLVKLDGYEGRYPKQLSGGQQQRIALARALVYRPQALLMDEPLGALDKKLRDHMQIEIKRIQKEMGITMIYVTHDQEEALNISDRIGVMNSGKIEQIGPAREIYEKPNNYFVADFIGDANIIKGRITNSEKENAIVSVWGEMEIKAKNHLNKSTGDSVHVVVRPERMRLVANEEKQDNCFTGTVWEASYVGEMIRYIIDIPNGEQIGVKEHNIGQSIESPGNEIAVGWGCEDALIV